MIVARRLALPFAVLALLSTHSRLRGAEAAADSASAPGATMRVVDGSRPISDRIVNGSLENFLPALAAVRDEIGTLCSGTMIGCRTLLTAANCFCYDSATGTELTGTACQARTDLLAPGRFSVFLQHGGIYGVEKIEINPSYTFGEGSDMALVTLSTIPDGVPPLSINRLQSPAADTTAQIAGFGRGADAADFGLRRSGLVKTAACTTVPAARNLCFKYEDPIGAPGTDSNSCNGDAGGPLLVDFGQGVRVAGIMSSGEKGDCSAPDQSWNTDVFVDRNWIEAKAGNDVTSSSCGFLPQAGQSGTTIHAASALLGANNPEDRFSIVIPAGTALLRLAMNGTEFSGDPDPDFDLYARFGSEPTTSAFDCKSAGPGLVEFCEIQNPDAGTWNVLVTRARGEGTYQLVSTEFNTSPTVCTPGPTTLCLNDAAGDKRFRVTVEFASPPRQLSGSGKAIALDSLGVTRGGLFWFFGADNPELLVKVLNGCTTNNHFWVYLTAGTDVGYVVQITDTLTGLSRSYSNRDGSPAQPQQDVNAFACN